MGKVVQIFNLIQITFKIAKADQIYCKRIYLKNKFGNFVICDHISEQTNAFLSKAELVYSFGVSLCTIFEIVLQEGEN